MLDVLFLGTGASLPSRDRAPPCIAVRSSSCIILLDCGEGSQRQMMISPLSFMKVSGILITHMHGDHVFGLPGMLQSMGLFGRKDPLTVRGPVGFKEALGAMLGACEGRISYPLDIQDMESGDELEICGMSISCFGTEHNMPSLGYTLMEADRRGSFNTVKAKELGLSTEDFKELQEGRSVRGITPDMVIGPRRPGLKVVYSGDTLPCDSLRHAAVGADLLIHESTYCDGEGALAEKHFHSTAKQAAITARDAGCKYLALVHISNRYDDRKVVEDEAKKFFDNSYAVSDMQMYSLTDKVFRLV